MGNQSELFHHCRVCCVGACRSYLVLAATPLWPAAGWLHERCFPVLCTAQAVGLACVWLHVTT